MRNLKKESVIPMNNSSTLMRLDVAMRRIKRSILENGDSRSIAETTIIQMKKKMMIKELKIDNLWRSKTKRRSRKICKRTVEEV